MFSDRDFFGFVAVLILIGIVIGAVLFTGLPWLWDEAIKPLLLRLLLQ